VLSVVLSFSLTAALATGGAVAQTNVPVIPFEAPKPAGPPAGIVAPGAAATPTGGPPLRPAVIIEGDPKDKAATPKPVAKVVASKPGPVKGKGAAGIKHVKPAPPPKPVKLPPPRPAAYELLLTFDDGPRLDTTPKVLETLEQYGIHSVFFVNGVRFMGKSQQSEKAKALMRETLKRGHIVGNHTIHHFFLCGKRGPTIAEREIVDNADMIREATKQAPPLFRTPFGSHCASLSATLRQLNITPIGWDIDPQDWKLQNADLIFEVMKKELTNLKRARSIVLFHDVQPATVEMLPRLLKWIADENLARKGRGEPPFKYIDASYLLGKSVPPPAVSVQPPAMPTAPAPAPPATAPAAPPAVRQPAPVQLMPHT